MNKSEILDFSGKTVIVTGGTRGLGRVISEYFLHAGANVVTCALTLLKNQLSRS